MRTKHVYPTRQIAHLWAHQTQDSARNPQGNFYFEGKTIYSYRSSWPLAMHVVNSRGDKAILYNTTTYSNTTSRQASLVRRSIMHSVQVINVSVDSLRDAVNGYAGWQTRELEEYKTSIPEALLVASRAREQYSKDYKRGIAARLHDNAMALAHFYDLDASIVPSLGMDISELKRVKHEARKLELKAEKEREAQALIDLADKIEAWRNGATGLYTLYNVPTMLRIKGDEVETSRGASFPIEHARKGLALVKAVMARGEEWHTNGHTLHLGHYRIDRIEKNGTVHAGCHVVTWPEIARIAPLVEGHTA